MVAHLLVGVGKKAQVWMRSCDLVASLFQRRSWWIARSASSNRWRAVAALLEDLVCIPAPPCPIDPRSARRVLGWRGALALFCCTSQRGLGLGWLTGLAACHHATLRFVRGLDRPKDLGRARHRGDHHLRILPRQQVLEARTTHSRDIRACRARARAWPAELHRGQDTQTPARRGQSAPPRHMGPPPAPAGHADRPSRWRRGGRASSTAL